MFTPDAAGTQASLFASSAEVVVRRIPRAAHAIVLERTAPMARAHALAWLGRRAGE